MPHRRAYRWLAAHPWTTSLIMVAVISVAATYRDVDRDNTQDRFAECVAAWADATARRADTLTEARRELDAANDGLWRTIDEALTNPQPDSRDKFREKLVDYKVKSDRYRGTLNANPPPPPPKLDC